MLRSSKSIMGSRLASVILSAGLSLPSYALCRPAVGYYSVTFDQVSVDGGPFAVTVFPHDMKWLRLNKNGIYVTGSNPTQIGCGKQSNCRGKYTYIPRTRRIVWLSGWLKGFDARLQCVKGKKADIMWEGVPGRNPRDSEYPSTTKAVWKKP